MVEISVESLSMAPWVMMVASADAVPVVVVVVDLPAFSP